LAGYKTLQGEVRFGEENSRIDFLLTDPEKSDCYVEVKSVTLLDNNAGYFPDSKTLRGQKHLRELNLIAKQGKRAVLFFCVQHSGIQSVQVAKHIDPDYAKELKQAMLSGVQILCYDCKISPEKIYINQSLPFFS
jgi:sugar fermentation stimulation protein A